MIFLSKFNVVGLEIITRSAAVSPILFVLISSDTEMIPPVESAVFNSSDVAIFENAFSSYVLPKLSLSSATCVAYTVIVIPSIDRP